MDGILFTPVSVSSSCQPVLPGPLDLCALKNFLYDNDIREIATALQNINYFDRRIRIDLISWDVLYDQIVKVDKTFTNTEDLVRTLFEFGYKNLSESLFRHFLRVKIKNQLSTVKRATPPNKKAIHIYFKNMKTLVHDARLKNPTLFFRNQAKHLRSDMNSETNIRRKQFLADKYIALLGAEIDAIAITYDTTLPNQSIFDELRSLATESTNTSLSEVVFYGRKANALAIAKNFEEGENMVKQAHCCANFSGPCLEIANMIYIDVYFKLWQYEHSPSIELKEALLYEGSKGLWALSEEDKEIRNLWKRMFLLRMIFCLLGLSNKGKLIPNCIITDDDITRAEKYLKEIDLNGIEARREMMYYIAKSRLDELQGFMYQAHEQIEKASKIAYDGNFKEIESIEIYKSQLKDPYETYRKVVVDSDSLGIETWPSLTWSMDGDSSNAANQSDPTSNDHNNAKEICEDLSLRLPNREERDGNQTYISSKPNIDETVTVSFSSSDSNRWSVLGAEYHSESEIDSNIPYIEAKIEFEEADNDQTEKSAQTSLLSAPSTFLLKDDNDSIMKEAKHRIQRLQKVPKQNTENSLDESSYKPLSLEEGMKLSVSSTSNM